jgi:hypothetical protein
MNVRITTHDNHTYVIDGIIVDGVRSVVNDLSSHDLSDAVKNNDSFYVYTGEGSTELIVPGKVVRQVTVKYPPPSRNDWDK